MKIIQVRDKNEGGQVGYQLVAETLKKGTETFGLATGSTPISIYDALVASNLDFSAATSINLDEYKGLAADHPQSYHYFMAQHLFNEKPFKESFVPDGANSDAATEVARYEKIVDAHPVDLQILGLGKNGHIGFNEPGTPFDSLTHEVALTESTITANARFFDSATAVPRFAYSMGIASIMKAKQILLVAYGAAKAEAVQAMIEGPVSEMLPASILQRHLHVTIILDEAAASRLTKK